ncbi:MAG: phytoene/squalene synthase family protein [Bacteroidales bacterium]|nr:phytoene/squalene synthase family protein [Bacteroidales bacterium]
MQNLFDKISFKTSCLVTRSYSTSFSSAVRLLDRGIRDAICSIYGFVRFADEIVDTFHEYDKKNLLDKFENDYYDSIRSGISLNPVLNSFQMTVRKYGIPDNLIQAFLTSMKTDLIKQNHNTKSETAEYIYGSAEVVGLMCLRVFVLGNEKLYNELEAPAKRLGSAFQKVNFLRDIQDDTKLLKRKYFHNSIASDFDEKAKKEIVEDVEEEFEDAIAGIKKLPNNSQLGVLTAFYYYRKLLGIIRKTPAEKLMKQRVRVPDFIKLSLLAKAYIVCKLNLLK